jgi:uncharacterized protein (DUF433 family)
MAKDYIRQINAGYYIEDTRVSLDSIVYAFLDGASPESILNSFPTLSLEQVYGALTFYLANRSEIDNYLAQSQSEYQKLHQSSRAENPLLFRRLEQARKASLLQKQK